MIDLIIAGVVLFVMVLVLLRKTSAGVAILGLLAGVLLDQLLSEWLLSFVPQDTPMFSEYVPVAVHLIVTFVPVIVAILAVKSPKKNVVLSILASLVLGFLMVFFGIQIVSAIPAVSAEVKNSGLFYFLDPYDNIILASGAVLAIVEMVASHRVKSSSKKKHA